LLFAHLNKMSTNSPDDRYHTYNLPQNSAEITPPSSNSIKPPRPTLEGVFAFAPNRDTLGATAYFIVEESGNILIDCPAWNQENREFLNDRGGVRCLFITHRGGISKQLSEIQKFFNCEVVIQEQESYLLPLIKITSFANEFDFNCNCQAIWTCGHTPGSSCLYWAKNGGVIFSGRHLLPKSAHEIAPLRTAKTFHWFRQLNSIEKLRDRFSEETLNYILPGANTGYLRGKGFIDNAYQLLCQLDLKSMRTLENE
jgi:glyoxylase-like metal-dependent hydrolase (beta-lactamase superfamily II)